MSQKHTQTSEKAKDMSQQTKIIEKAIELSQNGKNKLRGNENEPKSKNT